MSWRTPSGKTTAVRLSDQLYYMPWLIKRVSLWKPGTLFAIANGKMKCARDRAGCTRSLEAYVKQSPKMRRLRAVSLLSWSVEQNGRDTQMTSRVTEGARRERLPPLFLASGCFAAQRSRACPLPLLNLKKKRDYSRSTRCEVSQVAIQLQFSFGRWSIRTD